MFRYVKIYIKTIFSLLGFVRVLPHIALLLLIWKKTHIIEDIDRWTLLRGLRGNTNLLRIWSFSKLMNSSPGFRNLFYYRLGWMARFVSFICKPMSTLFIFTEDVGPGLYIQHGFSTIISAKKIGRDCLICQQVTIGFSNKNDQPVLGDNVIITAGAKVIGAVTVGDNVVVGANAVVVKDVPPNTTVVGVPARVIKRDGKRVNEML